MDPAKLADRLHSILRAPSQPAVTRVVPSCSGNGTDLERILGGSWRQEKERCFVVERRHDRSMRHGSTAVGEIAARLDQAAPEIALLACGDQARAPLTFFDLETTGLSGGAGTYAFLVGCAWFEMDGAFVTRQFLLTALGDERALLTTVAAELARAGALVSYNGKSFDAPLLESRYLFHRLEWIGERLAHIDVLHPARRFWSGCGDSATGVTASRAGTGDRIAAWDISPLTAGSREVRAGGQTDCSLNALERRVLAVSRGGDVPGFEIPARYFQFIRSGDGRPLAAVLEHNRLDLLSLAALTARLLQLIRLGPAGATPREALGLGRTYAAARLQERAVEAFQHAIALTASPPSGHGLNGHTGTPPAHATPATVQSRVSRLSIRIDALRRLALTFRRARRFDDAAACWRQLLEVQHCPDHLAREANQALAIHHEHRVRDLDVARVFALRSLAAADDALPHGWKDAVRHRLARIQKKMEQ